MTLAALTPWNATKVRFSSLVGQYVALQAPLQPELWDALKVGLRASLDFSPFDRDYLVERRELIAEAQRWTCDQLQYGVDHLDWYIREMQRLELMYWLDSAYLLALDGNIDFSA